MENISSKRNAKLVLIFIFKCVLLSSFLALMFIYTFEKRRGNIISTSEELEITVGLLRTANELPICSGNLLDQRKYRYETSKKELYYETSHFKTKSGSCQLLNYTTERIVSCLDALRDPKAPNTHIHFLFMGDSIIRQHYLNFVRMLPDYDKTLQFSDAPLLFKGDMEVTSDIMEIRISFRWEPFVSDDVTKMVRKWNTSIPSRRPSLVFLSMAVWHMFDLKHRDHLRYEKKLTELSPILSQLSKATRVIWLNQYPAVEFYGDINAPNTLVSSEKIHSYNKAVRRILLENQKDSNVQIWDSGNPLIEEYVRNCVIFRRYEDKKSNPDLWKLKYYSGAYRNCRSDIHAGYSVLSQITQLFYNDICSVYQM